MSPKKIDISQAKCSQLSFDSGVRFLRDTGAPPEAELTGFDIDAYTGAVVDRWWGKLVVAVDGIRARQQMPVFLHHDQTRIVGYSTGNRTGDSFSVQGVFSGATEAAAEVKALAAEGFPWQASIGVLPLTVLEIMENSSMEINGRIVSGPAEVWLESEVYETSFVPLGADGDTRVTVFSETPPPPSGGRGLKQHQQRVVTPNTSTQEQSIMDLQTLKKEHPDLVVALSAEIVAGLQEEDLVKGNQELAAALTAKGAQGERERIADVRTQSLPGHEGLIAQLELDGKSTGADAARAIVAAEKAMRQKMSRELEQQANPPVPPGGDPDSGGGNKTMKRAEFSQLSAVDQGNTIKNGVKIVD